MAHLFVACPKCGTAYKIGKAHASTEAVCRSCGHRWIPAEAHREQTGGAAPAPGQAAPAPAPPASAEPATDVAPEEPAKVTPDEPAEVEPEEPAEVAPEPIVEGEAAEPAERPVDLNLKQGSPLDALAAMASAHKPKAPPPADEAPPAPKAPAAPPAKPHEPKANTGAEALQAMAQAAGGAKGAAEAAPSKPAAPAAEAPDPLVGTKVNGFKVQTRLGTGGFGVVYRAFDTNLERSVAIKMLPANIAKAGKGVVERFLREARSAAKLAHPNIVTIHQICPYQNTYYIVMELVDGGALHEYLATRKRLPPGEATRIVRAAAEGLGHAHKRGIIHRDIKPGNIMLTNDGQVKVSDFGLARDVLQGRDIVDAGHSLGTPRYMAPEQALGEEPSAASDLYSLAATYYALLTGHAAFDGTNDREIMKKHVQAPVPDPRRHVPDLPVAVFRFFEKAMAKEPEDRYLTADEFIRALDRLDFSAAGPPSESQDLIDQIGAVSPEDRGSHLSETLGRAVRRAQRQRTPMPDSAVEDFLGASTAAMGRKSGWKLWVIVGLAVLVILGGAVTAAILLAPRDGGTTTPPGPGTPTPGPGTETPAPGTETPGPETPTPGTEPPPPPPPVENPLEKVAQEVLAEVRKYESDPDTPVYELIRMYKENVMDVYPGTQAATQAEDAIKRLQKGERLESGKPPDKPSETPPDKPPKPSEEPAKPDEAGGDAPPDADGGEPPADG